jgi:hypothetical protein
MLLGFGGTAFSAGSAHHLHALRPSFVTRSSHAVLRVFHLDQPRGAPHADKYAPNDSATQTAAIVAVQSLRAIVSSGAEDRDQSVPTDQSMRP